MNKIIIMIFFSISIFSQDFNQTQEDIDKAQKDMNKAESVMKEMGTKNVVSRFETKKDLNKNFDFLKKKKEEKKDEMSFLAPENFIGIIYFVILILGALILKRVFFYTDKYEEKDK